MNRKSFKKINLLLILTALIIIASYSILSWATDSGSHPSHEEEIYVVVEKGDTLWDIAKKHKKDKEDIREVIYNISKYNNMESLNIVPGQIVYIPSK